MALGAGRTMAQKVGEGMPIFGGKGTTSFLRLLRFVGDTLKDLEAGKGVGCRTLLVQTGQGRETLKKLFQRDPSGNNTWIIRDLFQGTDLIFRLMKFDGFRSVLGQDTKGGAVK